MADASHIRSCSPPTDRELERQRRPAISSLDCQWWDREPGQTTREIESGLGRVVNGVAAGVDRLKAIGNGQVSLVAATAWSILIDADKAAALNDQTFLSKARA
jgi:DNA (cytosine-5)-methyltransferase 1